MPYKSKTGTPGPRCGVACAVFSLVVSLVGALIYLSLIYVGAETEHKKGQKEAKARMDSSEADLARALFVRWQMNESADPCEDFYEYACGGADKRHELVVFHTSWNSAIIRLNRTLGNMLMEPSQNDELEAIRAAKTFFRSCMNLESIEARGVRPLHDLLKPLLDLEIDSYRSPHLWDWKNRDEASATREAEAENSLSLTDYLLKMKEIGMQPLLTISVEPDLKNSTRHVIYIGQPGLPLSRHIYLDLKSQSILKEYLKLEMTLMRQIFPKYYEGIPISSRTQWTKQVLEFEKLLAGITLSPAKMKRDEEKLYNKTTVGQLATSYPWLDWMKFLRGVFKLAGVDVHIGEEEEVVNYARPFLDKLQSLLDERGTRVLKEYFLWDAVYQMAGFLSRGPVEALTRFHMNRTGSKGRPLRVVTCIQNTNFLFPHQVGRMYAERALSAESREAVREMIERILQAFKEKLQEKDWMSEDTIRKALDKVDTVRIQVGSPAKYLNDTVLNAVYNELHLVPDEYFQNILDVWKSAEFSMLSKLREPVDSRDWSMSAAMVNAYYSGHGNKIVIPAGIIQTPMFRKGLPAALNYGALGTVIGHEITHGFDAGGRKYNAEGNMRRWWNDSDISLFNDKARCLVNQYSRFKDEEVNKNLDGDLTLDENIADNGGMPTAYSAFKNLLERSPSETGRRLPGLEAFTDDQLFFVAFAQMWCDDSMSAETRYCKLSSSYHSLPNYRVLGTLSNSREFSQAFNCKEGSPMNPHDKCEIW